MSTLATAGRSVRVTLWAVLSMATTAAAFPHPEPSASILLTVPQRLMAPSLPQSTTVALSSDGRVLAFESDKALLPADANRCTDIYVLDVGTRVLTLASEAWDGGSANGSSNQPGLSGDGRFVVFISTATNLLNDGRPTGGHEVYLRDRRTRHTLRVSVGIDGGVATGFSSNPAISMDGSTVTFESGATDLTSTLDANGEQSDVYAFDRATGRIERVSVASNGVQGTEGSFGAAVNGNGQMIAFTSKADLGCPRSAAARGAAAVLANVYLRDRRAQLTRCVSTSPRGDPENGPSYHAAIDLSGRWVAFASDATNLGIRDGNGATDIYLRDLETGALLLVSRTAQGKAANGRSWRPAVAGDASTVAFTTTASNLGQTDCGTAGRDANLLPDVYAFEVATGRTERLSTGLCGDAWWEPSHGAAIDARGDLVAFSSRHAIDPADAAFDDDVFVVRRRTPLP
jgi:Tol biopolymer transport system component